MKAVVLERYGTPEVLELRDVPTPVPGPGEVLVRVHAAAVNDWDFGLVGGGVLTRLLSGFLRPRVKILGCDVAGRVEGLGAGVRALGPGDEVYGDLSGCGFGAFAEYVCAPATALARKPVAMTYEQAAAIPQAGMLAIQGLGDTGAIRPARKILLNGAGGGVGTFALQLAKLRDAEVTVVDKAGKLEMLRELGADHVVDYEQDDFTRSGERYDLILDVKTNRSPFAYTRALTRDGVYATVGGSIPRLVLVALVGRLLSRVLHKHLRVVALKPNKDLDEVNELFEAGKLAPVIGATFRLDQVVEAFRLFGSGDHRGKIVLVVA